MCVMEADKRKSGVSIQLVLSYFTGIKFQKVTQVDLIVITIFLHFIVHNKNISCSKMTYCVLCWDVKLYALTRKRFGLSKYASCREAQIF